METKKVTTKTTATKAAAAKRTTARKACARKSSEVAINAQNIGFKAGDVYNALAAADKALSVEEIAKAMGIDREDIVLALESIQEPVSLFEPVFHDDGDALYVMDQISDKKNREENWVEQLSLSEAMKRLPARERKIIDMRFFEGKTQTEVAGEVGISQAQVSRLEKNALKTMRNYLN